MKTKLLSRIFAWFFFLSAALNSVLWNPSTFAANPGSIRMGWYLESGKQFVLKWPNRLRWEVRPGNTAKDPEVGVLKLWIAVPVKYQIQTLEITPAELFKITRSAPDFPEAVAADSEPVLFEMLNLSKVSTATFTLKDIRDSSIRKIILRLEMDETPQNLKRFHPTPAPPSRTHFRAGVQGTYVTYTETLPDKSLTQIGITAKFGVDYAVTPGVWSIEGGAFITALALSATVSPETLSEARFYGANGRFTYHPSLDLGSLHLSFSAGWYFWGMMVATANYGIVSIYGPQIFVNIKNKNPAERTWAAYLKVAPVVQEAFSLNSRELAIGGSYQLSAPGTAHPWYVTLDASNLDLPAAATAISSGSTSISLGLAIEL